ncbi:MAG: TIGR03667 family PPOX class F420-dependent oxidoreductase [Acidimicrobiia bacterium]|nr:TIGR03667 family PPOX class F420-dependent oxidoreductase [Acidimicrobiia bacterium]
MTKGLDPATEAGREAERHLREDVVGWLTTVAPDGRPQSSVISFLWDGETILFYSKPGTPKLRNIAANPRVTFHLNCDPYGDHVVTVEGRAVIDETAAPSDVLAAYRDKYRAPLAHWGMDEAETARSFSVPIRIVPERFRVW